MDPALEGRLAGLAAGRSLIIGYFTSRTCCAVIGDLGVDWGTSQPRSGYVEIGRIESVPIVVDVRLMGVLSKAGPELRPGGILRRGTPSIWLSQPAAWLDFLEGRR